MMSLAAELERGNYFLVNNEPVRVLRKEVISVGTHSHTKLKFYVQGLYTKGEKIITLAHADKVDIVDISRKSGQIISKTGSKVQIMDTHSYETFDAGLSEDLLNEVKEGDEVTFIDYNGNVTVIEKR